MQHSIERIVVAIAVNEYIVMSIPGAYGKDEIVTHCCISHFLDVTKSDKKCERSKIRQFSSPVCRASDSQVAMHDDVTHPF